MRHKNLDKIAEIIVWILGIAFIILVGMIHWGLVMGL